MYLGKITGLVVSDNIVYNTNTNGSNSTYLTAVQLIACDTVSVSGNVVLFGAAASGVYGFILTGVTNGAVVGNTVKTPTVACYLLSTTSQNNLVTGNRGIGGTLGVRIGPTGTNSGNVVWSNYMSGQSTAAYQDSSSQTNYMDMLSSGAMTIPGVLTVTGTLAAAAAATVATTLGVTGVATLSAGIAGGIPRGPGTWGVVAATNGTDSACTNGTVYCGSIVLPLNTTISGIQYLVGSIGGTDKVIVSLHASDGTLLANSATAGTTVGSAATMHQVPFTAQYAARGPLLYYVAVTFNGATAKFRTIPAQCGVGNGVVGGSATQTFGTPAAFTAPVVFNADTIPVASLY